MDAKPWWRLKEDALLNKKISELNLRTENTFLVPLMDRLYRELEQKGLYFKPPYFLADEWFSPLGIPAIGIPFYLVHPRLRRLEMKMMLEVEGGSKSSFMKLVRHETGHAFSFAYHLYKRPEWRGLFGSTSQEYPDTYRPRPYSRSHVIHLDNWYAQSHPDEDFAETFAVWLTPGFNWQKKYRGWKALKKLEYVNSIMKSIAAKLPKNPPVFNPKKYAGLQIRLKTYYQRKRKLHAESYPDFYDKDLKTLFTDSPEERSEIKASRYLKGVYPKILKTVSFWTKEKKYTLDQLMRDLISRCGELNLWVRNHDSEIDFHIVCFITTLMANYRFTGKFKRAR